MSVPPKYAGIQYPGTSTSSSSQGAQHTLELYLDYVCPFSAKLFQTLYTHLKTNPPPSNLRIILRQQIQPWHPTSTLTHESAAAVLRLCPHKYWEYSSALFSAQREFFDEATVNEGRNRTYERLAGLAGVSVGVDPEAVLDLLRIGSVDVSKGERGEARNAGNGVTGDIKWFVKTNRVIGVHVSPTVFFNGVEERGISSSFTSEQWAEWFAKNVV